MGSTIRTVALSDYRRASIDRRSPPSIKSAIRSRAHLQLSKTFVAFIALSPILVFGMSACAPLRGNLVAPCSDSAARSALYSLLGQENLSGDPRDQGAISTLARFDAIAASKYNQQSRHLECRGVVTFRAPAYKNFPPTSGPFSFSRDPAPEGTRFTYKLDPLPTGTAAKAVVWADLLKPPVLPDDYDPIAAWRAVNSAPVLPGECTLTKVKQKGTRLQEQTPDGYIDVPGSGSAVVFENGIGQVSYDTVAAVESSRTGDPVKLCLIQVPTACPRGDDRGKVYSALDLRTGRQWFLADSEHSCGGA